MESAKICTAIVDRVQCTCLADRIARYQGVNYNIRDDCLRVLGKEPLRIEFLYGSGYTNEEIVSEAPYGRAVNRQVARSRERREGWVEWLKGLFG